MTRAGIAEEPVIGETRPEPLKVTADTKQPVCLGLVLSRCSSHLPTPRPDEPQAGVEVLGAFERYDGEFTSGIGFDNGPQEGGPYSLLLP